MEGVGVAANVIAVVDLSAKVASLCFQYSKEVASAQADIQRLRTQVEHLENVLRATQSLVEGSKGQPLLKSQELVGSIRNCIANLKRLETKLNPNPARTAMRRLGLQALKWPFSSKEVNQVLSSLKQHKETIRFRLQINQTSILVDIQEGVKQLGLQATEDATISRKTHRMMPFPPNPYFVHRPPIEN
ncbi:hypothetical protein COL922a_009554 [Colletotrichum nupharicola]|nr:hypothetical protein COL922a_009554 [Colletotrichum nupharicola]